MNHRRKSRLTVAQVVLGVTLGGCTSFLRPPHYAEADALRDNNRDWGDAGDYCAERFKDRVANAGELPPFIAKERSACSAGDGTACRLWATARSGACGGVPRDSNAAALVMLRGCDLGDVDACVEFLESTPEGWLASRNTDRERARRRAVDFTWNLCRAGTMDRCGRLTTWYRERRFGLSQGEFDGPDRLLAVQCEASLHLTACRSLLDRELASSNTEAAAAIVVDECRCQEGGGCPPLVLFQSRAAPAAVASLKAVFDRVRANRSCFTCPEPAPPVGAGEGDLGWRLPGVDTSVRRALLESCHGGDDTACRSLLTYALSVDDDYTAIGVGLLSCGLGRSWGCDGLQTIAAPKTRSAAARRRAGELLCALNVQPKRPAARE